MTFHQAFVNRRRHPRAPCVQQRWTSDLIMTPDRRPSTITCARHCRKMPEVAKATRSEGGELAICFFAVKTLWHHLFYHLEKGRLYKAQGLETNMNNLNQESD